MAKPGRNERCACGSGKKYKQCCELKKSGTLSSRMIIVVVIGAILVAIAAAVSSSRNDAPKGVWSAEHGHYHDASGREVGR
jgi:hypothetical protein